MPMPIARIDRERRIETLAKNLFIIEGPNRSADLERAVQALLRANPGLAAAGTFKRGTVVSVPVDTGLRMTARVDRLDAAPKSIPRDAVRRLELGRKHVRETVEASNAAAETALVRLRDARFVRALKKAAPETEELIPAARQNLEQRIASSKETEAALEKGIEEAIGEIERLQRLSHGDGD